MNAELTGIRFDAYSDEVRFDLGDDNPVLAYPNPVPSICTDVSWAKEPRSELRYLG